jgi:hypothetical protein
MDDPQSVIKVNAPTVAYEFVDDEAIIINFETGVYHSLRGVGLAAWQHIAGTNTRASLMAAITSTYDGDHDDLRLAMENFLDDLIQADLVELVRGTSLPGADPDASVNERLPFEPPVLETFGDMADYLLMDPIHEVDDSGWPNKLPAPEDA